MVEHTEAFAHGFFKSPLAICLPVVLRFAETGSLSHCSTGWPQICDNPPSLGFASRAVNSEM